jgi:protein phosphatase
MFPIHVDVVGETDIGLIRERNEDVFLVADLSSGVRYGDAKVRSLEVGSRGLLFTVLDGMGGAAAGDRASQLAAETFLAGVAGQPIGSRKELARRVGAAVLLANRRVREVGLADPDLAGMGTTLTAAALLDDALILAHVGDSRAYLLRNGQLTQLTEDQSLAQELLATGEIGIENLSGQEHNNVILQALGVTEDLLPFGAEIPLRRDDLLLLCTDGLTGMVSDREIAEVLEHQGEDLAVAANALTALARMHGGHDNTTLVLARFGGDGLPPARLDEPSSPAEVEMRPLALVPEQASPWRGAGLTPAVIVVLVVLIMFSVAVVILLIRTD